MRFSVKHRIFWFSAIVAGFLFMAYLIVPPLVPLSKFNNYFAGAISNASGASVSIYGRTHLSLLGYPMISLENVQVGNIRVDTLRFRISWGSIFNLYNAKITSGIKVSGLNMPVSNLTVPNFPMKIFISNSTVRFLDKDYEIVDGVLDNGKLYANIRTTEHKYNLVVKNGKFEITNPNEGLVINGTLSSDENGIIAANGTFQIDTYDINKWFGFNYPYIEGKTKLSMKFSWDGKGNYDFYDIAGSSDDMEFSGRLRVSYENGLQIHKSIRMNVKNGNFDLTFLKNNPDFLANSDFNITASGNIKIPLPVIQNVKDLSVQMSSNNDGSMDFKSFKVSNDKLSLSISGVIDKDFANSIDVAMYQANPEQSIRCKFFGKISDNWGCRNWSYADKNMSAVGSIVASPDSAQITFNSENANADLSMLDGLKKYFGDVKKIIDFKIGNISGHAEIENGKRKVDYTESNIKLSSIPVKLPLPDSITDSIGNIAAQINDNDISFVFKAPDFSFSIDDENKFILNYNDAKKLLSSLSGQNQLPFIKSDMPVIISGIYNKEIISDLKISIADMVFDGSFNNGEITLKTKEFNLDNILNSDWFDKFEDNQYLAGDPILSPFGFGKNLTISADDIVMNGITYDGFIYSLDGGSQHISITDSENGNLLLSIGKSGSKYKYIVQLNKFFIPDNVFNILSPVNIKNTTITAQAELETYGLTAYDTRRNMAGFLSASFDGGTFIGLGTDSFYNGVFNYDRREAENAIQYAFSGGESAIKEFDIEGSYNGGDFKTTKPFLLTLRHTDITGNVYIKNDVPEIRANIIMRGTSSVPKPIALSIDKQGRDYSLSEMLRDIDLDYLREFVRTHKKF